MKKLLAALMALTVAGSAFATEIYVNTGHTNRGDYGYSQRDQGPRPHHQEHRRYEGPRRHHRGNAYGHNKHRGPQGGHGYHGGPRHNGPGPR